MLGRRADLRVKTPKVETTDPQQGPRTYNLPPYSQFRHDNLSSTPLPSYVHLKQRMLRAYAEDE